MNDWMLFPCRYSTKRKKLILSWKSRWHPSSNTWFCFLIFVPYFRPEFQLFRLRPSSRWLLTFSWVIHWCNKEISCRASVVRDVNDWILPAFSKFGQHQLLRRISRWINNLVPRVLPTRGHGGRVEEDPWNEVVGSKPFRNGAIFWMNNNNNDI